MEASVSAPPAQGAPPAPTPPPASGQGGQQGQPTGGAADNGFWGRFPNIPVGQRELLEPHLKEIQGYTTRLEQQYAPYKSLMDNVPADQVQNLVGFLDQWGSNPLETWMGLSQSLQQDGHITNPAFSVEQLQQLVALQQQQEQQQQTPGQQASDPLVQQMAARLQQLEQAEQQRVAQQEQQQQAQMLQQAHAGMAATLVQAGIPQEAITPELMNGAIIAHNGDVAAATNAMTQVREAILRGFTESNGSGSRLPSMPGGPPQAPQQGNLRPKSGDGFREASVAAEQVLRQASAAGAQG